MVCNCLCYHFKEPAIIAPPRQDEVPLLVFTDPVEALNTGSLEQPNVVVQAPKLQTLADVNQVAIEIFKAFETASYNVVTQKWAHHVAEVIMGPQNEELITLNEDDELASPSDLIKTVIKVDSAVALRLNVRELKRFAEGTFKKVYRSYLVKIEHPEDNFLPLKITKFHYAWSEVFKNDVKTVLNGMKIHQVAYNVLGKYRISECPKIIHEDNSEGNEVLRLSQPMYCGTLRCVIKQKILKSVDGQNVNSCHSFDSIFSILLNTAETMRDMHTKIKAIHRDYSPRNIFLNIYTENEDRLSRKSNIKVLQFLSDFDRAKYIGKKEHPLEPLNDSQLSPIDLTRKEVAQHNAYAVECCLAYYLPITDCCYLVNTIIMWFATARQIRFEPYNFHFPCTELVPALIGLSDLKSLNPRAQALARECQKWVESLSRGVRRVQAYLKVAPEDVLKKLESGIEPDEIRALYPTMDIIIDGLKRILD